jgi:hypothetical protein
MVVPEPPIAQRKGPSNVDDLRRRSPLAVDDHPLLAIWELTQACDLVCAYIPKGYDARASRHHDAA